MRLPLSCALGVGQISTGSNSQNAAGEAADGSPAGGSGGNTGRPACRSCAPTTDDAYKSPDRAAQRRASCEKTEAGLDTRRERRPKKDRVAQLTDPCVKIGDLPCRLLNLQVRNC